MGVVLTARDANSRDRDETLERLRVHVLNKKLSYRSGTARRVPVEILSTGARDVVSILTSRGRCPANLQCHC